MTIEHVKAYMNASVIVVAGVLLLGAAADDGCGGPPTTSSSGLQRATVQVQTGSDGLSVEQRNVRDRLTADNKPGSIKHLYVISAYSGQVLIYSTVRGKVTSSSKRLTPGSVYDTNDTTSGFRMNIGGSTVYTHEVLGDDGTYGDSVPYIYWFDAKGAYHQHYVGGGQIVHISDQPLAVKSIVLNMESAAP
jgi:hypothetical protein